jgi:predicted nucleotidyltransferase
LDAYYIPSRYPNGFPSGKLADYFNLSKSQGRWRLPVRSSDSVKFISLNRDSLLSELRRIVGTIRAEHPEVAEVRLFGSLARGDYTGTSDVDVLILLDHTSEDDPLQRILTFIPYFDLGRCVDVLVYSRPELEGRLAEKDRFMQRIWSESMPLVSGEIGPTDEKEHG